MNVQGQVMVCCAVLIGTAVVPMTLSQTASVIGREISVAEHLRDGQEYEPSLRHLIYFGDIDGRLGKMQILGHRPPYAPFSIMAAAPNMTPVRSKFTSLAMTIEENGVAVARLVPSERSMSASPCSQQSKA